MGRRVLFLVAMMLVALAAAAPAGPEAMVLGTVVTERRGCVAISTPRGFTVGLLREGLLAGQQQVLGEFHSLGLADVWDRYGNKLAQVDVVEFALDKGHALRWFQDRTEP